MRNPLRVAYTFAVLLLAAVPARAATLLVLESNPPSVLPKGRLLDGNAEITIPEGARVALLDERGLGVTVTGPYTGIPGGGEQPDGEAFLRLLSPIVAPSGEKGLGWSPQGDKTRPPELWVIDVTAGSAVCVQTAAGVKLWRPEPRPTATLMLSASQGAVFSALWPEAEAYLAWPDKVPVVDGNGYQLQLDPPAPVLPFVLHIAPAPLVGDAAVLAWLATENCAPQARMLLSEIAERRVLEGMAGSAMRLFP